MKHLRLSERFRFRHPLLRFGVIALLLVIGLTQGRAQFTAFNDHYANPGVTHPNATAWNVFGTTGGAPGNSGPLKDIVSGANLPVTLTITSSGSVTGGTGAGAPNGGTPAYNAFSGYIDWGSGTLSHAIQTPSGSTVAHVFTGLNAGKRYRYTCTGIRGNSAYTLRWAKFSLVGALAFIPAHTTGCLTNGNTGGALALNECAINTGDNAAGDLAIWEDIQPAPDGSFTVLCTQYTGPLPGGGSAGDLYGYAAAAEKLEEFDVTQTPAAITNQPTNQIVAEFQPATFSVAVSGNPRPAIQWYRDNSPLLNATNPTYTLASAQVGDSAAVFYATASNQVTNVSYVVSSSNATLTVNADTNAPTIIGAVGAGGTSLLLTFSEKITSVTALNPASYVITNLSGPLQITNIVFAPNQTNVILYTVPQVLGSSYTLTVNGLRDISAAANLIAPDTQVMFTAVDFSSSDIGGPALPGTFSTISGTGFNVTGAGSDIGGLADQFTFVSQQKVGDFDVKVRVSNLGVADAFSKAALMARESLDSNSVFAAAVATPVLAGCFFESRAVTGTLASVTGNFPANYPDTWLRLRREGSVFTGFAGVDGQKWVRLGSVTLSVGSVYLGFAVTSHNVAQTTTAQFREYLNTGAATQTVSSVNFSTEPLAASSRRTGMVISEIMYKPAPSTNTNSLEFVEIYNSNPFYEDISGWRLSGEIDYTFPSNTIIQGAAFLVIAKNPAHLQATYGIANVLGPYSNSLPRSGTLRLRTESDAIVLDVPYSNDNPWPVGADGTGHSMVLDRASYGEGFAQAWGISDKVGGSPGQTEPLKILSGLRAVMINEFLAHTDDPDYDFIELYNHSNQDVDVSGCYLSDNPTTNKFRIPDNTIISARGFLSFNQVQMGFSLSKSGENLYFWDSAGTRLIDVVQYEAQQNGVSMGRSPDGASQFYRLATGTPATNNAAIWINDIVINEIMYAPYTEEEDDQYVEIYNQGTNAINIGNWKFTSAIDYKFPNNTMIPSKGYIVVARDMARVFSHYPYLTAGNTFGPFSGKLSKKGERIALSMPDLNLTTNGNQVTTNLTYVPVEEVTYRGGGRWPKWANEGGSSMELIDPRADHRLPSNWADSDDTQKAPWTTVTFSGKIDLGAPYFPWTNQTTIDRLEIQAMGEMDFLIDNIEVRLLNGALESTNNYVTIGDSAFDGGVTTWAGQGNHVQTALHTTEGFASARSLRVQTSGNGDTGANRVRFTLNSNLFNDQFVVVRAKARWLRGWPEFILRLKGNGFETFGRMTVPSNLGTPGLPNSRAVTNAAPAIYEVVHSPIVPAALEPVVVTARAHDPDGVAALSLFFRNEINNTFTMAGMVDNGTAGDAVAGDGLFSATIPGQAANVGIAFYVEASDAFSATNIFPANAPLNRECVVRFNDENPVSSFGVYRYWLTTNNVNKWVARPSLSNEDIDHTFVVGNYRVIYNAGSHYSGSPYHQAFSNPTAVGTGCHFNSAMPLDDRYLGTDNFNKIHAPGNAPFDDDSLLREQTAYWMVRKLGLPYNYRRYVAVYVNGVRKGASLMEDTQVPGGDLIEEYLPDEAEGQLYKLQPWFEFDNVTVTGGSGAGFTNVHWCLLTKQLSTNNTHKTAAYRNNYLARATKKTANNYTNVYALTEAASANGMPTYWTNLSGLIDYEQWARTFAVQHAVGNWDSFGNRNAQNMYGFKPDGGKWKLFIWDYNIVLANPRTVPDSPAAGNIFQSNGQDPQMQYLNTYPPFRRAWWRAYKELVNGAMLSQNVDPTMDAKYAAFVANGITNVLWNNTNPPLASPAVIKSFINTARNNIAAEVARIDFSALAVNSSSITGNTLVVTGTAGVDATSILVNGMDWPVTWTTVTNWVARIPLSSTGSITNAFSARNRNNQPVYGTNILNSSFVGPVEGAETNIVFNEIMYNPVSPGGEYIELFNKSTNFTFDLSGWRINGLDYTFPPGSYISPRAFLVLARDRTIFSLSYGSSLAIFDTFAGGLQNDGETLTLIKPGATPDLDVVVDKVRYDGALPWPALPDAAGSSLQLVDVNQDNARVANWTARFVPPVYSEAVSTPAVTNDGWRFVSSTAQIGSFGRVQFWLDFAGSVVIDDFSLVTGSNAAVGVNLIRNGAFEAPLITNDWIIPTNMTASYIDTNPVHSGSGAFRLIATAAGGPTAFTRDLQQFITPIPTNQVCTMSLWYLATNTTATNFTARLTPGPTINANLRVSITPSNYIPPQLISEGTNYFSPGAVNTSVTNLPPFPPLWINEMQAENVSGITDNMGQRDPWIEIYNAGSNTVSLEGFFLAGAYTNLTEWAFPPVSSIGPTQFLVIFCDAQPAQASNGFHHTSFRLPAVSGSVVLSRLHDGEPQVLDYINYSGLHSDRSHGSFPDGQPFTRQEFFFVTPRGTNNGTSAPLLVFINEWMAGNTNGIIDPADNDRDDWFEIFNPSTNSSVDLAGFYLTDNLTNKFQYRVTTNGPHVIAPLGHLLVWADDETNQNTAAGGVARTDLHVAFKLTQGGEAIGIFADDGTRIDSVTFGQQTDEISQGRFPDGTPSILFMPGTASPRAVNYLSYAANTAPVLTAIVPNPKSLYIGQSLSFLCGATDNDVPAQPLSFSLDPGAPTGATISSSGSFNWTPSAPGSYSVTVRVSDNGLPPLSDTEYVPIVVYDSPRFSTFVNNGGILDLTWDTHPGQTYRVEYRDDLSAASWSFLQDILATGDTLTINPSTAAPNQRFYRVTLANQ